MSKNQILFYGQRPAIYGYLSNFARYEYTRNGIFYQTVEHDYQSAKFAGTTLEKTVREAPSPGEAKRLGRSKGLRNDWDSVKNDIMKECLLAKFKAHHDILDKLISTGDAELIEDSPTDYYWGRGKNGTGKNMLGKLLMEIRNELRIEQGGSAPLSE